MWPSGSPSPLFPVSQAPPEMPPIPPASSSQVPPMDAQGAGFVSKVFIRPHSDSSFDPYSVHRKMGMITGASTNGLQIHGRIFRMRERNFIGKNSRRDIHGTPTVKLRF